MVAPYIPTDEAYSYDATGNRLSSTGTSQSSNGSHNRLQTDGTYNYLYDNEGNTTRRTHIATGAVTNYTWDHRNRLATVVERVSVSGAITKQTQFTYDAFDNRVAKRVDVDGNGTWDRYEATIWADGQEAMRLVDSDGAGSGQTLRLANRYLWADAVDQLLSDEQYWNNTGMAINASTKSTVSGNTLWALGDHLGSIRDLLDNNGVIREHQVFDSYGRLVHEVDYNASGQVIASNDPAAVDTVFGYTGRSWDTDVNLQYNRARWYDPQTGRWLNQDPIGFGGGDVNLYRYVGNKVTTHIDPSGLFDWFSWVPPEVKAYPGQVGSFWKGYFWNGPINIVTGTASAVYNYDQTLEGIASAVTDPPAAASAIWNECNEKLQSTEGQGEVCFDLATAIVGATKAAKAAKLKKLQKLNSKIDVDVSDLPAPIRTVEQFATAEAYAGVREASRIMREANVPRHIRKSVLESFDTKSMTVRAAGDAEYGIRFFDNIKAYPKGRYLFDDFPATRDALALKPDWNQMHGFKQWQVRPGTTIFEGPAARQGFYPGGKIQKYIMNLDDLLEP
jgi:RHS repeat-associated protein